MPRVAVIEGDVLARMAMARIIASHPDLHVVTEAGSVERLGRMVARDGPDAICVGSTADGLPSTAPCAAVRRRFSEVGLVIVVPPRPDAVRQAQAADPHGLVNRSSANASLPKALRRAARGKRFVDPTLRPMLGRSSTPDKRQDAFGLTPAERRVLDLLPGRTNREVAAELGTRVETVKTQVSSILGKLDARDRAHAVAIAMASKLAAPGVSLVDLVGADAPDAERPPAAVGNETRGPTEPTD